MTIDTIDYYTNYSVSPKDNTISLDDTAYMTSRLASLNLGDGKSYFDQLSQYRFPTSKPTSNTHPRSDNLVDSPGSLRRGHSPIIPESPTTPTTPNRTPHQSFSPRSPRKMSHRRSTPVSLSVSESSSDSMFSDIGGNNGPQTLGTNSVISSFQSDSAHSFSCASNATKRLELKANPEKVIESKRRISSTVQFLPRSGKAKQHACSTDTPTIDLDVAAKPLRPRLGSAISFGRHSSFGSLSQEVIIEDEDDEYGSTEGEKKMVVKSYSEESIELVDFLRESVSDRAMSVSDDYDPFEYIHFNSPMWINSTSVYQHE